MARTGRPKALLELTSDEREQLQRWARRRSSAQALALRSRIVLECAEGMPNKEVAARLGVSQPTVGKWRSRFLELRLEGLEEDPGPGSSSSAPRACRTRKSRPDWESRSRLSVNGGAVSWNSGWTAWRMIHVPDGFHQSPRSRWKRSWSTPWNPPRRTRLTGLAGPWLRNPGFPRQQSDGSGTLSSSNRTAPM